MLSLIKPKLVDVEFDLAMRVPGLVEDIQSRKVNVLLSHHDTERTPTSRELLNLLNKMTTSAKGSSKWVKIVTTAKSNMDGARISGLYDQIDPSSEIKLIAFAMGEMGRQSRLDSGIKAAAPFTFAALDKAVAPGQLTIKEMQEIYQMMRN